MNAMGRLSSVELAIAVRRGDEASPTNSLPSFLLTARRSSVKIELHLTRQLRSP